MANELGEPQAELVLADHTVPPAPAPPILTEFSPPVPPPPIVRHDVSARTVAKAVLVAALTLGGLWVLVKLADVVLMLFIALLLTAALDPLVGRLARRAWPRPLSVTGIVLLALGLVALLLRLLVPPFVAQCSAFLDHLPTYTAQLHDLLAYNPQLQARLTAAAKCGAGSSGGLATGLLRVGSGLVTGTSDLVIVLVMTVYLLVDGDRTYAWITHYLPTGQRRKVRRALPEVSRVVSGYVLGQAITSLLFGVLAYVLLWVVGVPQPLLLAVVAALVDAIPVAGVLLATVPA
ncbi:MAG: AI-2E family transporter, partial [Acidimicrobiales bacterium]